MNGSLKEYLQEKGIYCKKLERHGALRMILYYIRKVGISMEMALNMGAFADLSQQELFTVDGGGPVALFCSCIGIAASPMVACFNPVAGAGLLVASVGVFINNC